MKVNGEAIYGTTASPFKQPAVGPLHARSSTSGATLYLHVFDWPEDGKLVVPGLHNEVKSAWLLATDKTLKTTADEANVTIDVPAEPLDALDTVVVLEVKGQLNIEKVLPGQAADGTMTMPARAETHGNGVQVEEKGGRPNLGFWTNAQDWVSWRFKLDKGGRFDVMATFATTASSSKFDVAVGEQKFTAQVEKTGSYETFKTVKLGEVRLEKGMHELTIKPVRDQWQAINLRSVTLKPID